MIGLMDKQKIIISHYREGKTQRQIHRETTISRKTIRKYIKEYDREKNILVSTGDCPGSEIIADIVEKPKYDTGSRNKVKLTDKIISRIGFHLRQNEEKITTGRSKQQKKKIDILEALKDEGFDIGYTTVCNAIKNIERKQKEAYIRQEYGPGDSCEFDWGEVKLTIAGKVKVLQM